MSELRYWKDVDDIPSGVVFEAPEDFRCVWVDMPDGSRELHAASVVAVKWETRIEPFDDEEDRDYVDDVGGPYLEVEQ